MRDYDSRFYASHHEHSLRSARRIVPLLRQLIDPKSVVDVGCGVGTWLSVFMENGIVDVHGIDAPWVEPITLRIPPDHYTSHDLNRSFTLGRTFDLVVSVEVAEHIPEERAELFIRTLAFLGDIVLFSAAIPYQGGTNHVNEQWPDYWNGMFAKLGFIVVDCLRQRLWDDPDVDWWYAQNMLIFARGEAIDRRPALKATRNRSDGPPMALVHPRLYIEIKEWHDRIQLARRDLEGIIPRGTTFVLIDQGQLEAVTPNSRTSLPFPEREGVYWGPPADDDSAVHELSRLERMGATHVVVAWPAFWWLDHYPGLYQRLRTRYRRLLDDARLRVFERESIQLGHAIEH